MAVRGYFETLDRFDLEELKHGGDLQIENGDLVLTDDGDVKLGDDRYNALFRFVERWRVNEPTINDLFCSVALTTERLDEVKKEREAGSHSLSRNPEGFHAATETIVESEHSSSVYAGAILVVLNNMLRRFWTDIKANGDDWKRAGDKHFGHSAGEIFSAAAANFRHHDEWARSNSPNPTQLASMTVLGAVLEIPTLSAQGFPTIGTNVCREVLQKVSRGSVDDLHSVTFDYVKCLASTVKSRANR